MVDGVVKFWADSAEDNVRFDGEICENIDTEEEVDGCFRVEAVDNVDTSVDDVLRWDDDASVEFMVIFEIGLDSVAVIVDIIVEAVVENDAEDEILVDTEVVAESVEVIDDTEAIEVDLAITSCGCEVDMFWDVKKCVDSEDFLVEFNVSVAGSKEVFDAVVELTGTTEWRKQYFLNPYFLTPINKLIICMHVCDSKSVSGNILKMWHSRQKHLMLVYRNKSQTRPYLNIFNATGSPCHELTSRDNSTPPSI